jgi:hypothetical protein
VKFGFAANTSAITPKIRRFGIPIILGSTPKQRCEKARTMHRDPDLLREIMLAVEAQPAGKKIYGSDLKTSCANSEEVADHVQQLIEAGCLDGTVHFNFGEIPPKIVINRTKNAGHDFLSAMREDTVWQQVKKNVMLPAGSWTIGIALEYAKTVIRAKLGLP